MNIDKEQANYYAEVIDGVTYVTFTKRIAVDKTDFEQRVKVVLMLNGKSQYEICKKLNIIQSNFLLRCRTGKFTFEEKRLIAEALGCKIVIKFNFDDGAEYVANTAYQLVFDACAHVRMSLTELSERLGKSKQAFGSRLTNGRFTESELAEIAEKIGCVYSGYFELENGIHI